MSITVSEVKTYLTDRLQGKTGTLESAVLERAMLHGVRMLAQHYQWSFLRKTTQLVTVAEYTTGYVDLGHGDSAVVGSGTTFVAAHAGQVLVPNNQSRAYVIETYNSATSLTLESVYISDTAVDADGVAYSIYYRDVTLPSDFRDVEAAYLSGDGTPDYLNQARDSEVEQGWALRAGGGTPRFFTVIRTVASGVDTFKLRLYPAPDTAKALSLVYHRWPTEPDVTSEVAIFEWPDKYRDALFAACFLAASRDVFVEMRGIAQTEYRQAVEMARLDDSRHSQPIVLGGQRIKAKPNRYTIINTIAR